MKRNTEVLMNIFFRKMCVENVRHGSRSQVIEARVPR